MNKTERLAFIKSRHAALFGVALAAGMLPVTRKEIASETKAIRAKVASSMDDSIADSDKIEAVSSALPFDSETEVATHESESESMLNAKERRQLAHEVAQRRAIKAWLMGGNRLLLTA